ncbi:MAG: ExbD/TolR family protein [bacterium]
MTPIMNLMVVLIPLLLSSAQLIKISVIELNLPPAKGAKVLEAKKSKEDKIKLDLAVTITDKGFYLSSSMAIMRTKAGPSLPKREGEYDFVTLSQQLYEIKKKAIGKFQDVESIIIQAEPQIDYQTLVSTMDATRSMQSEGKIISLFPKVSVSALIL